MLLYFFMIVTKIVYAYFKIYTCFFTFFSDTLRHCYTFTCNKWHFKKAKEIIIAIFNRTLDCHEFLYVYSFRWSKDLYIYMFSFGEYKSKQVKVSGIQHYLAQILGKQLRTEILMPLTFTCLEIKLKKKHLKRV